MERLDKLLAATGQWSRKEAKALVKAGRVQVGGARPKGPEDKVAEGTPVTVDGRPIATEQGVYVMLHKPAGVVSSTQDPRERTVLDLLPQHLRRRALFPVGRLDKDTEGLLLLTNDGPLAHALLAPGRHVDKVYYVEVDGRLDQQDRRAFQAGVTLADGTVCQPADLTVLPAAEVENSGEEQPVPHVEFRNVTFSYTGVGENIGHLSIRLMRGESLGILGATGSGKSTILNLLMRFYDPDQGQVLIDGRDVRTIPPEELRPKFGVVFQNDFVAEGTIADNIRFFRPLADEALTGRRRMPRHWSSSRTSRDR